MTRMELDVVLPVAASLIDPGRFLPDPARPAGPGRWVVEFAFGPFRHDAVVTLGPAWRTPRGVCRAIAWEPAPRDTDTMPWARMMPRVHGELATESGRLHLRVDYDPRVAVLGRVVDVLLRPWARASMRAFVEVVAVREAQDVPDDVVVIDVTDVTDPANQTPAGA